LICKDKGVCKSFCKFMIILLVIIGGVFAGWVASAITYRFIIEAKLFMPHFECPRCLTKINGIDVVPLLGYIVNAGRCHHCGQKISPIYPLLEILCPILFVFIYFVFAGKNTTQFWLLLLTCYILFMASVVDIETLTVADLFLYVLLVISVVYCVLFSANMVFSLLFSLSIFFLLVGLGKFMSRILHKQSIGFGDVILIPILTNYLPQNVVPHFIIASGVLGIVFGFLWNHLFYKGEQFPFIPPIFAAFLGCLCL